MNLLRSGLTAIVLSVPALLFAKGDITGKVTNKETGQPMDFVTVQLINSKGKALPVGATTDEDGRFTIPGVADGNYTVRITSLGSVDQERVARMAGKNVDIGVVPLADDSKLLQEVVVEGIRSQMKFELDKKVFSVDANIASAGQSASELLENIPSVEVDQDGEVSLRGNSSVTVWINGKESGLTADNRAQILEQIPAETIEKVEVITNPSAKYSPEGTAGIINIVLRKDRKGGYFGSAEIGANSRGGANASVNFNYNSSKWESFASIGARMRHNRGGSESRRRYDDGTFLNSDGTSRNHGNNIFVRLGTTYHLTDHDSFYLNGFGMFGHRWGRTNTLYLSDIPGQWNSNNSISRNRGDNRGAHGELGYTHKFSDNHTLDIMGGFNYWGGPSRNYYLQQYGWPDGAVIPDGSDEVGDIYQEQEQRINVRSWEAKIDYSNTFSEYLKLEAGFQGNYNNEDTPVTTWQGTSQADMVINPELYNRFIYRNNISALYATLGGRVKSFSWSAGLRAEAWQIRTKSLTYGEDKASQQWWKKNAFALFPSLFLSYSLPHDNEIQINYTRRIRRPWGGQLNSFRDISNPTNITYGNPELEPQYTNSFELNYLKSWTYHMLSVSAYMKTATDRINRISYIEDGIMYTTNANVADINDAGVEIVGKNSLFRGVLDLTTTVNLYNNHLSAWSRTFTSLTGKPVELSGKSQNSFAWDARVMATARLLWSLSLQVTGRYDSKHLEAQGSHQGGWTVDAGIRKVFGNWSVSLNCRDIFDSRKFKNTINGIDYTQDSKRWRGGRRFSISVKYSFGNMKSKPNANRRLQEEPQEGSGYGEME